MEAPDGQVILEEEVDENYEPTDEEILEYAHWLGMDPIKEKARSELPFKTRRGGISDGHLIAGDHVDRQGGPQGTPAKGLEALQDSPGRHLLFQLQARVTALIMSPYHIQR
jgi:hypothetical protein